MKTMNEDMNDEARNTERAYRPMFWVYFMLMQCHAQQVVIGKLNCLVINRRRVKNFGRREQNNDDKIILFI